MVRRGIPQAPAEDPLFRMTNQATVTYRYWVPFSFVKSYNNTNHCIFHVPDILRLSSIVFVLFHLRISSGLRSFTKSNTNHHNVCSAVTVDLLPTWSTTRTAMRLSLNSAR